MFFMQATISCFLKGITNFMFIILCYRIAILNNVLLIGRFLRKRSNSQRWKSLLRIIERYKTSFGEHLKTFVSFHYDKCYEENRRNKLLQSLRFLMKV